MKQLYIKFVSFLDSVRVKSHFPFLDFRVMYKQAVDSKSIKHIRNGVLKNFKVKKDEY